ISIFTCTSTSHFYSLSLHDALPISMTASALSKEPCNGTSPGQSINTTSFAERATPAGRLLAEAAICVTGRSASPAQIAASANNRSEEHTSELQSHLNLVCRLLLEKK